MQRGIFQTAPKTQNFVGGKEDNSQAVEPTRMALLGSWTWPLISLAIQQGPFEGGRIQSESARRIREPLRHIRPSGDANARRAMRILHHTGPQNFQAMKYGLQARTNFAIGRCPSSCSGR